MGICPKVNVIARLAFELTYYDVAVQHVSHYATKIPHLLFLVENNTIKAQISFQLLQKSPSSLCMGLKIC